MASGPFPADNTGVPAPDSAALAAQLSSPGDGIARTGLASAAATTTGLAGPRASGTSAPAAPQPSPDAPLPRPDPRNALAGGATGTGGRVRIIGRDVHLGEGLLIDVSGPAGGGTVLAGGELQGQRLGAFGTDQPNAQTLWMAPSAQVRADATAQGHGGVVILWADDTARIHGHLSARGGPLGGDGGFIETSGKRFLDVTRAADASAPQGKGGMWLLDPESIRITTGSSMLETVINPSTIEASLNAGTNVQVVTDATGSGSGFIAVDSPITKSGGGTATLTLNAHGDIYINADIKRTAGGNLNLVLVNGPGGLTRFESFTAPVQIDLGGGTLTALGTLNSGSSAYAVSIQAGNIQIGELQNWGGASSNLNLNGPATITSASVTGGQLALNGNTTIGSVALSGGTLGGSGNATITGAFNVTSSGTLSGTGSLTTQGATSVGGSGSRTLTVTGGKTWVNQGTLRIEGNNDRIAFSGSGQTNTLQNTGTLILDVPAGDPLEEISGTAVLQNLGVIQKLGSNAQKIKGLDVTNASAGTIDVQAGTLELDGGSITQSGLITTAASTTFKREGNLTNSGTLAGSGTVKLGSSYTLTNSGTISPGGAGTVGTLTLTGSLLSSSSGRLLMEANGTGATQRDLFSVSGAASLNGTLSLTGINSFNPAAGQSYTLLSAGSAPTGSFSSIQVPSGLTGAGSNSGNNFVLTLSSACLGVCWDGGGGSNSWTELLNWSGDALPTSTSIVYINSPVAVSLAGGTQEVAALNMVSGSSLQQRRRRFAHHQWHRRILEPGREHQRREQLHVRSSRQRHPGRHAQRLGGHVELDRHAQRADGHLESLRQQLHPVCRRSHHPQQHRRGEHRWLSDHRQPGGCFCGSYGRRGACGVGGHAQQRQCVARHRRQRHVRRGRTHLPGRHHPGRHPDQRRQHPAGERPRLAGRRHHRQQSRAGFSGHPAGVPAQRHHAGQRRHPERGQPVPAVRVRRQPGHTGLSHPRHVRRRAVPRLQQLIRRHPHRGQRDHRLGLWRHLPVQFKQPHAAGERHLAG
jgi:hypothetical protein